jgi:hypothetical protein
VRQLDPEGLGLGGADVHAQHLAPPAAVDADGDDHRRRDDAAVVARLHIGGLDPQIRPVALHRTVEKSLHFAVDLLAQTADLALRYPRPAHRLDQIVDRAGRGAVDIGFLDDGFRGGAALRQDRAGGASSSSRLPGLGFNLAFVLDAFAPAAHLASDRTVPSQP